VHIRQVALVARDLEPVVTDLRAVLGLPAGFVDPGVAAFGLRNEVLAVGTTFLEVVSPVEERTTAGRFLARRGGDGGYMVILQTRDLAADRRRLAALGVRIVWEAALGDIATAHLHPRDVGGAIVSLDEPRPAASWRWGGPGWEGRVRTDVVRAITGVTIGADDPARMARRWAEVLGLPAGDGTSIALDGGTIRFVASGPRGEGVAGVALEAADAARAVRAARERGLVAGDRHVEIAGVRFDLA
jgi:glyoxalase-like protein